MDFEFSADDVATVLAKVLRAELSVRDGTYFFALPEGDGEPQPEVAFPRDELQEMLDELKRLKVSDELILYDDNSYQVLVRQQSSSPATRLRSDILEVIDQEADLQYRIAAPSDSYLIWLMMMAAQSGVPRDIGMGYGMGYRSSQPSQSLMELVRNNSLRILTLTITSVSNQPLTRYAALANSFLFQLAYNFDIAVVAHRYFEEASRRGRIRRMRRSRQEEELDPPRRTYNEDLVSHYVLAASTDGPTVQFLSYYHILEHYFETVFTDALIAKVRDVITHPGFSYRRQKDIDALIKTVTQAQKVSKETVTINEPEALRLALLRYVDLEELRARLTEYEKGIIDYYRDTQVPFSAGAAVDLCGTDVDQVMVALGKRIYATRNSLVHSKNGDKARYKPFRDERALSMEIPLVRFISEAVILRESKLI